MINRRTYTICVVLVSGGLFLIECQEPYKMNDTNSDENYPVVYARLSNSLEPQFVKLTWTCGYNEKYNDNITGAKVFVIDENGIEYFYSEINPGYYQTERGDFIGEIGKSYTLIIDLPNGSRLQSYPQTMPDTIGIDTLSFLLHQKEKVYTSESGEILTTKEYGYSFYITPVNVSVNKAYYRLNASFYVYSTDNYSRVYDIFGYNETRDSVYHSEVHATYFVDCYSYYQNTELPLIGILSDKNQLTQEERTIEVLFLDDDYNSVYTDEGKEFIEWIIMADIFSLSEATYNYYSEIKAQLTAPDRTFDPIPTQLKSNLFYTDDSLKPVLGYFEVSSRSRKYNSLFVVHTPQGGEYIDSRIISDSATFTSGCKSVGMHADTFLMDIKSVYDY